VESSIMDMPMSCKMNMLFTWSCQDLCIVFRWWHITSTSSFVYSLFLISLLAMSYELVKALARRFDNKGRLEEEDYLTRHGQGRLHYSKKEQVVRSLLYAVQLFIAFFNMLVFMTYNGWVMVAVTAGAGVGFYLFGGNVKSSRDAMCH